MQKKNKKESEKEIHNKKLKTRRIDDTTLDETIWTLWNGMTITSMIRIACGKEDNFDSCMRFETRKTQRTDYI